MRLHIIARGKIGRSPEADLFIVSDRPVYEALDLLRIEREA